MSEEINIVILGSRHSGKNVFTKRYLDGCYTDKYSPIDEDTYRKQVEMDGICSCLNIYYTTSRGGGGPKDENVTAELRQARTKIFENANAFVIVYSIINETSFQDCLTIHEEILPFLKTKVPIVLCGNMCDFEEKRVVSFEQGQTLSQKFEPNCIFLETSGKGDINVDECFRSIIMSYRKEKNAKTLPNSNTGSKSLPKQCKIQ